MYRRAVQCLVVVLVTLATWMGWPLSGGTGASDAVAAAHDGTVWAWGHNDKGQLGDGTTVDRRVAVQVPGLTGFVAVAAGAAHSVALKADGTVWAWGDNSAGQVGAIAPSPRTTPFRVRGLHDVTAIAAGVGYHTLALEKDGSVWAWGANQLGQLGNGTVCSPLPCGGALPSRVPLPSRATAIAAGQYHSLALTSDGTVWAWGQDCDGELGNGTFVQDCSYHGSTTMYPSPVRVLGPPGIAALAAGGEHSLARSGAGVLFGWGWNRSGQVGYGDVLDQSVPTRIAGIPPVQDVVGGERHSLALGQDGTVWAWGDNQDGQLGLGQQLFAALVPRPVPGLTGVVGIGAGGTFSVAVKGDGSVWAWGSNEFGQLANGGKADSTAPVHTWIGGMRMVAAGQAHGLALR